MSVNGKDSYQFRSFRLDLGERQLLDKDRPVPLTPKAFDVLVFLVVHSGHLVEKDELMRSVWGDSFVEEANIPRVIHTLRRALGEDDNGNKYIETVAKKGYRFVAQVDTVPATAPSASGLISDPSGTPSYGGGDGSLPKARHAIRPILLTGFAAAISLILLLSFIFRTRLSAGSNDVRSGSQFSTRRSTTNDEAYRLCLLGSALAEKTSRKDAAKAIEVFEQALVLDPNYAPAYAGLANVHNALAWMGGAGNPTEEYLKAKTAVEKALALDENLAEAHSYLGEIKTNFEWDFAGAEREHKRAVELDPHSASAHRLYALFLGFLGRAEESLSESKTAIDLEPASVLNHYIYERNLFYARRYAESIAEGKRTLEMDPDFNGVYDTLVGSNLMSGDEDEAFQWFLREAEQKGDTPEEIEAWKIGYAQSGWQGIRERQLAQAKESEKKGNLNPMPLARLYTKTGDREQAFVYLEKAYDRRMLGMIQLKVNPAFDPLRSDPRFDELVRRVGLK